MSAVSDDDRLIPEAGTSKVHCNTWHAGGERLPLPGIRKLYSHSFDPATAFPAQLNQHRTFGGIERCPKPTRPSQADIDDFRRKTEHLLQGCQAQAHVVAFVNSKSGGMTGQRIMDAIKACFDNRRRYHVTGEVCDLSLPGEPDSTIARLADVTDSSRKRLLVCGGDGTVTWILTALEQCHELHDRLHLLPVGIVPLGTGNDLARSLGWGGSLRRVSDILHYLNWSVAATPVILDQWRVVLRTRRTLPDSHKLKECGSHPQLITDPGLASQLSKDIDEKLGAVNWVSPPSGSEIYLGYWQNYFSIGVDAKVARHVDISRSQSSCGRKCFQRGCGKACYGYQAASHAFCTRLLSRAIDDFRVAADGGGSGAGAAVSGSSSSLVASAAEASRPHGDTSRMESLELPRQLRQLMLVNINSYAAGLRVLPSRKKDGKPPTPNDGKFEVLSLGTALGGLGLYAGCWSPRYSTSTSALALSIDAGNYMQLDGEPWYLEVDCDILVEWHRPLTMMRADGGYWRKHIRPDFWDQDV
eukprot:CAMPEP_0178382770 /NCGR_PEP_ID=MMETSP0689_2-20121128/6661_1 /TAXON_ID=160604 /ORGANISM="Amphidinium massartii, Strain CS-259" /LENGTH=527 /DNA_ID=CAMNT_0020002977 /DNA_START=38 /DNA_END=1621 /DNA_ORIENTATION=+